MVLVLMKIYNCYYVASHSIENNKALSAYMTEFSSFNIIDPDILVLEDKEEKDIEEKNEVISCNMISNPINDELVV